MSNNSSITTLANECQDVLNLAKDLNMDIVDADTYDYLGSSCCDKGSRVSCNEDHVVGLHWSDMGLNGTVVNSHLPPSLTYLDLSYNQISGQVPELPDALLSVYLYSNKFTGSLPKNFPSELEEFIVVWNELSGEVPPFPPSVTTIWLGFSYSMYNKLQKRNYYELGTNRFTGTLYLSKVNSFAINDNYFTDVIIEDDSNLSSCDIGNNPLLDSPHLSNLTVCYQEGLYNASDLPKTVSDAVTTQWTSTKVTIELTSTETAEQWATTESSYEVINIEATKKLTKVELTEEETVAEKWTSTVTAGNYY
eukprot:NODE_651_length_5520_cov_0.396975.p2 type:complete len:307 gc:universal NODE_651_length_5520_cov_0.396975:692-1612(+)